jgi:hypothetical protein
MMDYDAFLTAKMHSGDGYGFDPAWVPDFLFDFQRALVEWSLRMGRSAIFADCGLGKTPMQLVWAENIARKTGGRVLIVTPIAVGHQTVREGEKFGIGCAVSREGKPAGQITVTNYERLHLFRADDYQGVVCDESSILKNFDGVRRGIVTEFMRTRPYRLLCTATAAPNDYIELGTSSEALGVMGNMDMLNRFFRNQSGNATDTKGHWRGFHAPHSYEQKAWRFKGHAEEPFWRWVCSWARACRRPSDMGFDDDGFILPPLQERETVIDNTKALPGNLFVLPAVGLREQRMERRINLRERCETVARLVDHKDPVVMWCQLNEEGDVLESLVPGSVQVSGNDSDERKEEVFLAFSRGDLRALITKPRIGGFGLNWQHCAHVTFFPSHSYEQYYQGVRRCWRFGQKRPVVVDIVTTKGELGVLKNLQRKSAQADVMFTRLVAHMGDSLRIARSDGFKTTQEVPTWL